MMTARSEHRLSLRHSTADARLTPIGRKYGLTSDSDYDAFTKKMEHISDAVEAISKQTVHVNPAVNSYLSAAGTSEISVGCRMDTLLRRPQVTLAGLSGALGLSFDLTADEAEEVELKIKYEQYIERQNKQNRHFSNLECIRLPKPTDYTGIHGLSSEAREKLGAQQPENLAQASKISGVSPADIAILMTWLKAGGGRA